MRFPYGIADFRKIREDGYSLQTLQRLVERRLAPLERLDGIPTRERGNENSTSSAVLSETPRMSVNLS